MFGGSFDPFHVGHFLVAQAVWELFRPARVIFLPCSHSPLKKSRPMASDSLRLSLLRGGLRGVPWAQVSDWELRQKGPSYSIHTALHWKSVHPGSELDWILGSDQWSQIRSWRNYRELGKIVRFLVFPRPEMPKPVRGLRMRIIPMRFDLSASDIRSRIRLGKPVRGMVLSPVERMIQITGSYR